MNINNFCFLNYLIIGLFNSSGNSLLDRISFLTVPPVNLFKRIAEVFYQKNYKPLKQVHVDIHHILDF